MFSTAFKIDSIDDRELIKNSIRPIIPSTSELEHEQEGEQYRWIYGEQ